MTDESAALSKSRAEKKPLMIDFTADWCAACHEFEEQVFQDPKVARVIQASMIALRLDITDENEVNGNLISKYGILGLPSIIFIQPDGTPLPRRIHKLITPEEFLEIVSPILTQNR